ncbi:MAG TPA: TolC family protein [Bacteroidota bacterium]
MVRPLVFALAAALVSSLCPAQVTHTLTLEQSLERAMARSFQAAEVKSRYLAARKSAESARRRGWTSLSLAVTAPDYSESMSQQFNPITGTFEYFRLKQTNMQGSLTLSQPFTLTGGTLRLRQFLLRRDQTSGLPGGGEDFRDYFGDFAIEFNQPLLTPNLQRVNALRAENALDQAESDFLQAQADLVYNVTRGFYDVFRLSRQLEIAREQVRQDEESYRIALGKSRGGLIPEVESLQSEVDLAASRNDSLQTGRTLQTAKNAFRLLVGIPTEEGVDAVGEIAAGTVVMDEEQAVACALANRADVLSAARAILLREADVDQARSQSGFRVDLAARYGLNRNDEQLDRLFHDQNTVRAGSLTLSVPIFDWGSAHMNVEAAEIQFRSAVDQQDYTRQQVRQEVLDLVNQVRVAESRLRVLDKTVAVAQRSYDISQQRFQNGNISRNDLAQAQQRLTQAKTNSLNALIDYKLGLADLKRKTLWDFERGERMRPVLSPTED